MSGEGRRTKIVNPKLILCLALVLSGGLFGCTTDHQLTGLPIRYYNAQCNFTFYLPTNWQGYSVLMEEWEGKTYLPEKDKDVVLSRGPIIVLRNPQWKTNILYQDIPIYIFTRQQWDDIHLGKYDAVGAGGDIDELWHNDKFVLGIHSRYNADDSINDWKEVQDIVKQNCAAHGMPHLYAE
jgi:hypothetical protein